MPIAAINHRTMTPPCRLPDLTGVERALTSSMTELSGHATPDFVVAVASMLRDHSHESSFYRSCADADILDVHARASRPTQGRGVRFRTGGHQPPGRGRWTTRR